MSKAKPASKSFRTLRITGLILIILLKIILSGCFELFAGNSKKAVTGSVTEGGNTNYAIYLKGRVLNEDSIPLPNVEARLVKTSISAVTDADGYFVIFQKKKNSTPKKSGAPVDTIHFIRNRMIVTQLHVNTWIDSLLPDVFILTRSISGSLIPSGIAIGKVTVELYKHPNSEKLNKAEIWYDQDFHDFSGYLNFLYAPHSRDYSIKVLVYDTANRLTGQSACKPFNELAGDITIPAFNADNLLPIVNAGAPVSIQSGDTLYFRPMVTDSFGGKIVEIAWDIGATGHFSITANGDTMAIAPEKDDTTWLSVIRVMDNDGNIVKDTLNVTISKKFSGTGPSIHFTQSHNLHVILDSHYNPFIKKGWKPMELLYTELFSLKDNKWKSIWNDSIYSSVRDFDYKVQKVQSGIIHLLKIRKISNTSFYEKYVLKNDEWIKTDAFNFQSSAVTRLQSDGSISKRELGTSVYPEPIKERVNGNWVDISYQGIEFKAGDFFTLPVSPNGWKFIIRRYEFTGKSFSQIYQWQSGVWMPLWANEANRPNEIYLKGFTNSGFFCQLYFASKGSNSGIYFYSDNLWNRFKDLQPKSRFRLFGAIIVSQQDIPFAIFGERSSPENSLYIKQPYRYINGRWAPIPNDNIRAQNVTLAKNEQGKVMAIVVEGNTVHSHIFE